MTSNQTSSENVVLQFKKKIGYNFIYYQITCQILKLHNLIHILFKRWRIWTWYYFWWFFLSDSAIFFLQYSATIVSRAPMPSQVHQIAKNTEKSYRLSQRCPIFVIPPKILYLLYLCIPPTMTVAAQFSQFDQESAYLNKNYKQISTIIFSQYK